MAAITINTNINSVLNNLASRLGQLKDRNYLLRPVAIETIANMKQRIHKDGEASDGGQIGTYSSEYMRVRTGVFLNSGVYKSGKRKGETKDSGVITRGPNKGERRPQYNRSGETKVIVSLTRQLENDWAVIATEKGYGIGFNNPFNVQKMRWVEENKGKVIANLTESEQQYVTERLDELVQNALNT